MPLCRNKSCQTDNGKRAKLPKDAFPPVCNDACKKAVGDQAIAQSNARAKRALARARDTRASAEKEARKAARCPAKKKLKSIARLRNDVAELLQKLVRMKAADPITGMCQCVTCGAMDHWKNLQGGHFIERGRGSTKLLEENCHPQCRGCNAYRMKTASGVLDYRRYMVSMYGEKAVNELELLAKQTVKHTRHELEGMAFEFKRQIQEQEHRLSGHVSKPMESAA